MTLDLDTLLRDADPLRNRSDDDAALLRAVRARVDRERDSAVLELGARRPRWRRRVALVAAAAAVLTAVPVALDLVDGNDGRPPLLAPAVAADGTIVCNEGYASIVDPRDAAVRLLPDRLPSGWSYTRIFAREDTITRCVPPSLTALRQDAQGRVTGRVSVTGPVAADVDQGALVEASVPDTVFGHDALRFDLQPHDVPVHRWVWTDDQGRQWSAEASGMPLDEGRQVLTAVTIDGPRISWAATAQPGWTLVHLREGAPYGVSPGQLTWWVEMTTGTEMRMLQVYVPEGADVPLLADSAVGDQLTTVGGAPAVLGRPRGGEDAGGPPGSEPTTPVLVEVAPGTVAWSWGAADELPEVQAMLESLRQVGATDPRLSQYGTD